MIMIGLTIQSMIGIITIHMDTVMNGNMLNTAGLTTELMDMIHMGITLTHTTVTDMYIHHQ
jgi:phosphopantothenoylcysteine synthetase/decarboxylase